MKHNKLVIDTAGFVKNVRVWELAEKWYTVPGVLYEIRDRATKDWIAALPVEIVLRDPTPQSCKLIGDFSKKTGDYGTISVVDLKVLALTYELEVEEHGGSSEHLKKEPTVLTTINNAAAPQEDETTKGNFPGFYRSHKHSLWEDHLSDATEESPCLSTGDSDLVPSNSAPAVCSRNQTTSVDKNVKEAENYLVELNNQFAHKSYVNGWSLTMEDIMLLMKLKEKCLKDSVQLQELPYLNRWLNHVEVLYSEGCEMGLINLDPGGSCYFTERGGGEEADEEQDENVVPDDNEVNVENGGSSSTESVSTHEEENSNEVSDDKDKDASDDDDGYDEDEGWITPGNFAKVRSRLEGVTIEDKTEDEEVLVACLTSDFAMQNVLRHMGLHIIGVDGRIIKHIKNFIQRCFTCTKTTPDMSREFCKHCGNKTLKRVSVTLNPDGSQMIWINYKKQINKKGMKYSLPTPRGGQHASYPQLTEDQPRPHNRGSKLSKSKTDVMSDTYLGDYQPFCTRDVNSRAALLGIRDSPKVGEYWETRNPNQSGKRKNKKKKK